MARVKTLLTHNNPPGTRRNPGDVYDCVDYQMLTDKRIVEMAVDAALKAAEVAPAEEEEIVVPPPVANKQMGAEKSDSEPSEKTRRKYARRDMTAEG